jgi:5-methylcytosine-specific restriction endonuclease McrA
MSERRLAMPYCGSSDHLQVHHICSRSLLGDDTEGNLITLCADCHSDIYRSSSSYRTCLLV